MTEQQENTAAKLDAARQLVERLEAGDAAGADRQVDELTRIRETELFREVGQLTRELHEALKAFKTDTRLAAVAEEIPDAQDRLTHVIDMTEQSAHRTLTAVEQSLGVVDGLSARGAELRDTWHRFRRRELSAEEFRELSRDLEQFLDRLGEEGGQLQAHLTEALMAQDYQDLTGQIIRRVINLVQEVEAGLVSLISISGRRRGEEKAAPADKPVIGGTLEGPQVPGRESASAVSGQDEVDDLLSSLGF